MCFLPLILNWFQFVFGVVLVYCYRLLLLVVYKNAVNHLVLNKHMIDLVDKSLVLTESSLTHQLLRVIPRKRS